MRAGDGRERRGGGGGATRDLRDHLVRAVTVESSAENANSVVGVLGGVGEASTSNLREI